VGKRELDNDPPPLVSRVEPFGGEIDPTATQTTPIFNQRVDSDLNDALHQAAVATGAYRDPSRGWPTLYSRPRMLPPWRCLLRAGQSEVLARSTCVTCRSMRPLRQRKLSRTLLPSRMEDSIAHRAQCKPMTISKPCVMHSTNRSRSARPMPIGMPARRKAMSRSRDRISASTFAFAGRGFVQSAVNPREQSRVRVASGVPSTRRAAIL
jgi:hypothetical protein